MADDVVGKLIFQVNTDVDGAKKGLEDFQEELKDTQEEAKKTDTEVGKASEGISVKGVAIATAVGVAVMKLGQEVAKATNEIQSGQANIVNATGATGEALSGLMESAKAVYADSEESFDEVSRAIGEVNTRLGYTGEALESTTGLFLDFADATGQDVQQSVIAVTQAMNRWNLDAEELPLLLDKLTVAGQASGVSVSALTANLTANASTLQAMGYSMDDAIAMMMQFEKQGIDSNAVLMAMKKSFEDSANAGTDARADWDNLLDSITNATDQTEANALAVEAFGSRIATDMVVSLQSGKLNFDEFAEAVANAEGTLEATDEASKTTADRIETLKHSITLMLSEVGEEIAPIIEDILPTVKQLLEAVFEALKPIIPVLGDLIKQLLPPLMEIIIGLVDVIVPIIENVLPPLASLLKLVGTVLSAVLTILNPILSIVTDVLGIGMDLVSSMLTPLLNLLTPIFQLIADAINAVLTPLVTVMQTIVGWIESIVNGIKWLFGWLGDGIKKMLGFSDAVDETEQELVSFSGAVGETATEVKDYSAEVVDMTEAIEEGAKAFDIATPAVEAYKVEINKTTEAVDDNTKAVKDNAKEVKTTVAETTEAIEGKTEATNDNTKATEKNTENTRKNKEAQEEAERLANERLKTTENLNAQLLQQNIQIREQGAKELELAGDIEGAYAIRARLLDEEMARELSALEKKVRANEASELDITKLKQIYANKQEQLNKQKDDAIRKQDEALKKEQERLEKEQTDKLKAEEDERIKAVQQAEAERKALHDSTNAEIVDATNALGQNLGVAITGLIHEMTNGFATAEDKVKSLKSATLAFAGLAGDAMYQLGKDLVEGNDAWTNLGKTALKALASIVRALAEEMAAQAVIAGFEFRYGAAAALTAGSVAAFIGAGLIDGYADSLMIGKDYIPYDDFPARLHRGEMVLDRMDAEKFRRYGGMYGVEQMASAPLSMDTQRLSPLNINNQLSAVIEVDGTQLGIAVLKNIDNASQFVLR